MQTLDPFRDRGLEVSIRSEVQVGAPPDVAPFAQC